MKQSLTAVVAIIGLSLAVWYFFYAVLGEPFTPQETIVVVGASALIVLAAQRLWTWVRKLRTEKR